MLSDSCFGLAVSKQGLMHSWSIIIGDIFMSSDDARLNSELSVDEAAYLDVQAEWHLGRNWTGRYPEAPGPL